MKKALLALLLFLPLFVVADSVVPYDFKLSADAVLNVKDGQIESMGSSVAIARDNGCTIEITAAHNISEGITPVIVQDVDQDVAIIRNCGPKQPSQLAKIAQSKPAEGEKLSFIAYQPFETRGPEFVIIRTILEGISLGDTQYKGIVRLWAMAPIRPGMSGGGAFNSKGELVGVILMVSQSGILSGHANLDSIKSIIKKYDEATHAQHGP